MTRILRVGGIYWCIDAYVVHTRNRAIVSSKFTFSYLMYWSPLVYVFDRGFNSKNGSFCYVIVDVNLIVVVM